jgi:putative ABC transport system permease protein
MLARASALAGARRTASTAAPVLLTIAFAVFIAGSVQMTAGAHADRRAAAVHAGSILVPDDTPGLTDAVDPTATLSTVVYIGADVVAAVGVDSPAVASSIPGLTEAPRSLTGPHYAQPNTSDRNASVVLSRSRAGQLDRRPGDSITARFADGEDVPLTIIGVAPDGTTPAEIVLERTTVRIHDPSALAKAVPVTHGTSAQARPPAMDGVPAQAGARAVSVGTYAREADAEEDRLVWIFTLLLIGVSVGYGAMAVANTLVMATGYRARDFGRLRLAGATPRQVLLTVAAESAVVVAIGVLLGLAVALLALWGTTRGLAAQTGIPVALAVPWPTVGAAMTVCLVLALAASVLPARARLRRP